MGTGMPSIPYWFVFAAEQTLPIQLSVLGAFIERRCSLWPKESTLVEGNVLGTLKLGSGPRDENISFLLSVPPPRASGSLFGTP